MSLYLKSFNTQNVINMEWMFGNCSSLRIIDLTSFNMKNVKNMKCMFNGCSSLKLDKSFFVGNCKLMQTS